MLSPALPHLLLLFLLPPTLSHIFPSDPSSAALTSRYLSPLPPSVDPFIHLLAHHYPAWHRQHRHTARRLVYTFNHTQPGLGDRFRGLFTAYIQAAFSHRVLLLEWDYPFSVYSYLSPSSTINVRYRPILDAPRRGSYFRCTSRTVCAAVALGPMLGPTDTIFLSQSELGHSSLLRRISTRYPTLPLSRALVAPTPRRLPTDSALFTHLFAAMFDPETSLRNLLRTHPHGHNILRSPFVSVHARLGEGVGETRGRFDVGNRQRIANCLADAAILAGERQRLNRFYLATDTPSFLHTFRLAMIQKVPGAQVLGGDGPGPVHSCRCGGKEPGSDEKCAQTFLELLLLSKGKAVVASNSGFSVVATHIGNVSDYSPVAFKMCGQGKPKR